MANQLKKFVTERIRVKFSAVAAALMEIAITGIACGIKLSFNHYLLSTIALNLKTFNTETAT
jgi:hypothetical protein